MSALAIEVSKARAAHPSPDALQATALIDLISGDTSGTSIERSISFLEMATRLDPTAGRFSDLSAARLVHAAHRGGARALVEALDAASRAVERAPKASSARYNRALALDLLGLDTRAREAWSVYLGLDSTSRYAAEAKDRLNSLNAQRTVRSPSGPMGEGAYADFARRAPAEAQLFAWDTLLGHWGRAFVAGDTSAAGHALDAASWIGARLAHDQRDYSVQRATDAIRRARHNHRTMRQLATFHAGYAEAQARTRVNEYAAADSVFGAILSVRPPSRPLVARAALAHANALVYRQQADSALEGMLRFIVQHRDLTEPVLDGRAHWNAGVLLLRRGRTDEGLNHVAIARSYFAKAGDEESVAGTTGLVGEAHFVAGDADAGFREAHGALLALRGRPQSLWRHNNLLIVGRAAARAGLLYAARAFEDEDAAAAGIGTRFASTVEALSSRARSAWLAGSTDEAQAWLTRARATIARVNDRAVQTQLRRDLDLAAAIGQLSESPDSAASLLTSVIAFYTPIRQYSKLIPAYVARAAAWLALGRAADADRDMSLAAALYDSARTSLRSAALQHAIAQQARSVYDSLVVLHIRRGQPARALAAMERGRVSFDRGHTRESRGPFSRTSPVVDYALIGGTLMTWIVVGSETSFVQRRIGRSDLANRIERVRTALELGASESSVREDLGALHDMLLSPVESRIGGDRLAIVADGELSGIPFAALWDRRRQQYLVERFATSMAPTLRSALAVESSPVPLGDVSIIVNPVVDNRRYPLLVALPGAEREAFQLATVYPRAHVLAGRAADSASVAVTMMRSAVVHFAGHALLDDAQPWRSTLVLSPRGLNATAIANLDLHRLRLVALSACETMRAPDHQTGGFAGLTDAFLAAGAAAVLGSLWRVNDEATRKLMTAFHINYRNSGDAARALRLAQLGMLERGQRSPAAWASFRLMER